MLFTAWQVARQSQMEQVPAWRLAVRSAAPVPSRCNVDRARRLRL